MDKRPLDATTNPSGDVPSLPTADLQRVLSDLSEGFLLLDRSLRYVFVNDAATRLAGIAREAVLGRRPEDLFPPAMLDQMMPHVRRALADGQPVRYEVEDAAAGRWYENRLHPTSDGVAIFFTDVTAQKEAEHERARVQGALRESRDVLALAMRGGRMGAWARDLVTNAVWWSRELEELFGLPPGGFEGTERGFLSFVHEDTRDAVTRAVDDAIASRTDYIVEFRFRHASGEWRWMEGRGRAVYAADGSPQSLYGLGIDITERKAVEQALAAARDAADADAQRLQVALLAARLGDWKWDALTDVVTFSRRGAEIFGVPPDETLTWTELRGLLHPDDRERARLAVEHALASHEDYAIEYRLVGDGPERWVSASGRGRYDEHGQVLGMLGVVQDLTRDRLLVRVDDAVRALVDPDEITYTAARLLGAHLDVERCAYATLEDDQDTFQLTGNYTRRAHSIVGRYRFRQFGEACLHAMRTGHPFVVTDSEVDGRILDEDRVAYRATGIRGVICVPVHKSGRAVAAMAVHTTHPRQWRTEEVELVQQVASRCWESLERARVERERVHLLEAAEAANQAKDQFLAMLGHELRNPLSPILTALQLMQLRGDTSSTRERTVIERQVRHLTRLVDDLLDVARIARGKVDLRTTRIELRDVVASAVEMSEPVLQQRNHTLVVDVPRHGLPVDGDPARLSQVLSNLLTNAARYTPPGGQVAVRATRDGTSAVVSVSDNGLGIAPDVLPKVFDLFVQGRQAIDRAEGGLGLGLTIVKSLVERHGGSVAAHSEGPGRGSTFTVRLPLASMDVVESAQAPARVSPRRDVAGCRILIVDDNHDAAAMLHDALALHGYTTHVAHDGPAALQLAERVQPHAAFVDIGLPLMDGYEVAARLRQLPGLDGITLVAVTGYGQQADRERTQTAGFDRHLVKPVDVEELQAVIEELGSRPC